ncbi:hypothetical protein LL06_21935 [Hoeflea sp. BAL378]|nr:hypothetical protein LL06_21935 [Hoeflea sp. BAL378]
MPSILSALLRLLVMAVSASLLFSLTADALELTRNGKTFGFDAKLPKGVKIRNKGVDRLLAYKGVEISVRLIQDHYADCGQLVREREDRMSRNGGYVADAGTVVSQKECRISLYGAGGAIDSTYTFLDACKCYAAMHVTYPDGVEIGTAATLVSALARALASRPEIPSNAAVAETIDKDWKEAFDIFRKRKLTAQLAYGIYVQSATFALQTEREGKAVLTYLAGRFGIPEAKIRNEYAAGIDWFFDVETGKPLYGLSPQEIARTISSCYAKGHPGQHCKLAYHQEMGCRMTRKWATLCSTSLRQGFGGVADLCWGEPRGDMPMLPVVKDSAERSVQLPNSGKGTQVETAKVAKKPVEEAIPYCDDNDWRSFYAERGNRGIPQGLLP